MAKDKKQDRKTGESEGSTDAAGKTEGSTDALGKPEGSTDAAGKPNDGDGAKEPKPKFGTLYKAAVSVQDEIVALNELVKDAKKRLSDSLEVLVKHHGSGPWKIDGQSVSVTSRGGGHYFRGLGKAQEVSLDD